MSASAESPFTFTHRRRMNPQQPPYDPNNPHGQYPQQGYDPNQQGYVDPNQPGYDPNQQGYVDPNMAGYQGLPPQQVDAVAKAQRDAQETRSRFAALGMALLVHALIFALLAWIVLDVLDDDAVEIIVESAQGESDIPIQKKEFMQNMQQKPSAAASQASTVISASVQSPVRAADHRGELRRLRLRHVDR